jgi:hypothetical protein
MMKSPRHHWTLGLRLCMLCGFANALDLLHHWPSQRLDRHQISLEYKERLQAPLNP